MSACKVVSLKINMAAVVGCRRHPSRVRAGSSEAACDCTGHTLSQNDCVLRPCFWPFIRHACPHVSAMAPNVITDPRELNQLVTGYKEAFLLVGFSEKAQFKDVAAAATAVSTYLAPAQQRCAGQPFLIIYGGDPIHVPTIGSVVKTLKDQYHCHVLAIQAAGKHEDWVDSVFICEEQFETVQRVQDGFQVEVKQTLYGGTRHGKPVGGARYYMTHPFYANSDDGTPGVVKLSIFLGGGAIAAEELEYTHNSGAPWVYVPCKCGNPAAYNSAYGPLHDWVVKQAALGIDKLAVTGNARG